MTGSERSGDAGVDEVGVVGLGKMGGNVARNLSSKGYDVVGYDVDEESIDEVSTVDGITGAYSYSELADSLQAPRVVWLSVPCGDPVDESLDGLLPNLNEGDVVVDAGNSNFKETQRRYEELKQEGVH
ncbi:MAG: NAD(P)-binding domain-containing protein, partial [Halobacteria archaeon]|nr:NAD(P)-binding domain-containing protein [Halobacteria archaeon]